MYEELVERLRAKADYMDDNGIMLYAAAPFYLECADAIEELSREYESIAKSLTESVELVRKLQSPSWIPVTERLPEENEEVLVVAVNFFNKDDRWAAIDWLYCGTWQQHDIVTHWMPLPEPPKEEKE